MEFKNRTCPQFSACGLNCGLCPRYHTDGASKCPGCAGEGFSEKHPPCGMLSCAQRKGLEYCYLCEEYPCKKYDGADLSDSFITHKNQFRDNDKARAMGQEAYIAEQREKLTALEHLLKRHDNGRRKSFYCLAVNLLELEDVNAVLEQIAADTETDAVSLFEEMAVKRSISLKLRKKVK